MEELDPKSNSRQIPLSVRSGGDGNSNEEDDIKKAEAESRFKAALPLLDN